MSTSSSQWRAGIGFQGRAESHATKRDPWNARTTLLPGAAGSRNDRRPFPWLTRAWGYDPRQFNRRSGRDRYLHLARRHNRGKYFQGNKRMCCRIGHNVIRFLVTGTIRVISTLPPVTHFLTIEGAGITLDGGNAVQVIRVYTGARLKLKNLIIINGNSNFAGGDSDGGGIHNDGKLEVVNCTFSQDFGVIAGGAILNETDATIIDSIFSDNFGGMGGGAISNSGTMTVIESTFSGNVTPGGGGAIVSGNGILPGGTLTVVRSTFSQNGATDGGAILNNGGTLSVINSTFFNNSADGSGGIDSVGTLAVTNSTFLGNMTLSDGAAIGANSATIKNTILAGSTFRFGGGPAGNCAGTIIDNGYNISDDASCGFSATGSLNNTNPMLDVGGLENNGGPTETISLLPGSPAIDAIPLAACTDQESRPINTDQRGALRPDVGEDRCDVGAYEFQDLAGEPNCQLSTREALEKLFGDLKAAALALGFPSVKALRRAVAISCGA
jgi:hypothetical protein